MGNNKLLHWTPYNFSFYTALSTMYIKQGFHISLTVSYKHLISALKLSFPSINNLSPGKFLEFAVHCNTSCKSVFWKVFLETLCKSALKNSIIIHIIFFRGFDWPLWLVIIYFLTCRLTVFYMDKGLLMNCREKSQFCCGKFYGCAQSNVQPKCFSYSCANYTWSGQIFLGGGGGGGKFTPWVCIKTTCIKTNWYHNDWFPSH